MSVVGPVSSERLALKDVKDIIGLDPDKGAVNHAHKTIKGAKFVQGSALDLPFKSNTFDVVLYFDVIEHVPKFTERQSLQEIHRVLKLNGLVILSTCYKHPLAVLFDPAFWAFGHRHYSKKELREYLKDTNFSIEKIFVNGGWGGLLHLFIACLQNIFSEKNLTCQITLAKRCQKNIEKTVL